ncbi:MAG: STAS domain-containing protein [SAR324 cluster bacterium]|nr:STAS domain-containing protein [SAR324 cluster bacterium]
MIVSDRKKDKTCIFDIAGEISGTTARNQHLNSYIKHRLEKDSITAIALNLEKVEAVDSYGLGVIIQLYKFTKSEQLGFVLFHANGDVSAMLNLSGLNEITTIVDSEEDALAHIASLDE